MSSDSIKQSFVFITRPSSTVPIAFYLHPSVATVLVTSASMKLGYCNPIDGSCSKWTLNNTSWCSSCACVLTFVFGNLFTEQMVFLGGPPSKLG